ncbi:hypothetical protein ABIA39_002709 [Nocardia sp. GAS34]
MGFLTRYPAEMNRNLGREKHHESAVSPKCAGPEC